MLQAGGRALLFGDRGDDTHGVLFSGLLDAGELSLLDEMEVQCIVDAVMFDESMSLSSKL